MTVDRFKTRERYFETNEHEIPTPFKIQYLRNELSETNNGLEGYETSTNYPETNEHEIPTPFKIQYLRNELSETSSELNEPSSYKEFSPEIDVSTKEVTSSSDVVTEGKFYEKIVESNIDSELFSNEVHDPKLIDMLGEIANETEEKFQNFMYEVGDKRDFTEQLIGSDFQLNFHQFFESNYRQPVIQIEGEIEKFSQYLERNVPTGMTYENVHSFVDSYPVKPELFSLGGFLSKAKSLVKGAVNVAKKVASKVGQLLPLNLIINKILKAFKGKIEPILKSLLQKAIGKVPEKYRPLAQKALDFMSGKLKEGAEGALQSEIIDKKMFQIARENFELFESGTTVENQLYGVDQMERNLDEEMLLVSQNMVQENEPYRANEIAQSEAMIAEEYLDSEEAEVMENELSSKDKARTDFISGLTSDAFEIKDITQNFIPAAYPLIKMAMKIPGARDMVVKTIAGLASPILAKLIGKDQAAPLSKVLVDAGLRLIQLETPEAMTKEQYLGATAANIVTEATDRVLHLPDSILEAGEDIVKPFARDAVLSATADNVPSQVLSQESLLLRQIPLDTYWALLENGKYKIFSKIYRLTINPKLANSIHTGRRGETLLRTLMNQGWDCINPIPIKIRVFQATPFTRLSMIARRFLGGAGRDKIRQIAMLNPEAATLLIREPQLAIDQHPVPTGSIAGLRFYIAQIENPEYSRGSNINTIKERPDDVNIKFIGQSNLEVKLYFSSVTHNRIKNTANTTQAVELYREIESLFLPTTKKVLGDLLNRLLVPSFAINEIIARIQIWVLQQSRSNLTKLVNDFLVEGNKDGSGTTITISLNLQGDFITKLTNLTTDKIGEFLTELTKTSPSADIKVVSGYDL